MAQLIRRRIGQLGSIVTLVLTILVLPCASDAQAPVQSPRIGVLWSGIVASLARPGGTITGLSLLMADLPGKRLELLKATVPHSARVAVLVTPALVTDKPRMNNLTVAARALGLHLRVVEVRRVDELDTAFAAMTRAGADAVLVI